MKNKLEKIIFTHLVENLPAFSSLLVLGHSTKTRPKPYITIDCGEDKPFNDLPESCGLFEIPVNISIADSADDINYVVQNVRVGEIRIAMENFQEQGYQDNCLKVESFDLNEDGDARDDNDIGNVISYTAIVQRL